MASEAIGMAERYGARNYDPLPVVIARAEGAYVWDEHGRRYLDFLSAYGAVNQGHRHPRILAALAAQAARVTLTSRAFHNDQLGAWLAELSVITGLPKALPMNTGAEAVETAIKLARKWGERGGRVKPGRAKILAAAGNFHGRTVTIVSFSTEEQYRDGFGPFTPGFEIVPFGDAAALEKAIDDETVAFLVEPIQAEAGVCVPPDGYLARAAGICRARGVLFMLDEIQTGFARTGRMFCHEHESGARPDVLILGKSLGGGVLPVSAVAARDDVMAVLAPGDHGSTFGGNPLACAVSRAAMDVVREEKLAERAAALGERLGAALAGLPREVVREARGKGLLRAIELTPAAGPARRYAQTLADRGLLAKETHGTVLRFAPPLTIPDAALDEAIAIIGDVFARSFA